MDLVDIVLILLGVYLLLSILIFYALTNNIFIFRPKSYKMGLEDAIIKEADLEDPKIHYYLITHPDERSSKWVILLHSWGRDSARMMSRAKVYYELGYSILAVDAPGHGKSQWVPYILGTDYKKYVHKITEREDIQDPIVHGLSFGAIAAVFFASDYKHKALVAEALATDFEKMYEGFFNSLKLPSFLFGWIPALVMKYNFDWEELAPRNLLPDISGPIFLIHGESDTMFPVNDHFHSNLDVIQDRKDVNSWVVPASAHSKMARHPLYREKLIDFIKSIELE